MVEVGDLSSVLIEAIALKKPVISIRLDAEKDDEPLFNSDACIRTNIQDFENALSNILENEQFRDMLLKNEKTFLAGNMANQGSASTNIIKFLDSF